MLGGMGQAISQLEEEGSMQLLHGILTIRVAGHFWLSPVGIDAIVTFDRGNPSKS